jgi:hypothetical protein
MFWTTKREFLSATREGVLVGLSRANSEDQDKVIASVERILITEYQIPPLTRDCYQAGPFRGDVLGLLGGLGALEAGGLTTQPPNFVNRDDQSALKAEILERMTRMRGSANRDLCDGENMGRGVLAPYKAALLELGKEYNAATFEWVKAERARRVDRYQGQLARQQQQEASDRATAQQAQAASRAAEQQSINAENARIKAEQERRALINKNRVGG